MGELYVYKLGSIEYDFAFQLQDRLQKLRINGDVPDMLLLLEHPPTLTLAKGDDQNNILVAETVLNERGVSVFSTDRGGSITWHGPGQIVGYPILNLNEKEKDIHLYIQNLESVLIETLKEISLDGRRDSRHVGVWVGDEKIAAIGVKVKKWVTKHGFALNVNSDLSYFDLINPCGIIDKGVTSIKKILGRQIDMGEVMEIIINKFSEVFNVSVKILDAADSNALLNVNH